MFRKLSYLFAVLALSGFLSGCMVAESKYLKKEAEADTLTKELRTLQQKHENLISENATLKAQVDKLENDFNVLKAEQDKLSADRDKLDENLKAVNKEKDQLAKDFTATIAEKDRISADRDELDKVLRSKSDSLSKIVRDLRGQNASIEVQNRNLQQEIIALKKSKEQEVQTVSKTYDDLLHEMKGEVARGQIMITELKGKLTLDVLDEILFDSGVAEIKPEGLAVMKRVVDILKNVKNKAIRVEGHTDNRKIGEVLAKKYPTNWELSATRATNVAKYLQKQGIDPAILSAAAYGEYKPVADNGTSEGRAKNRRIAIVLLPKD